MVKLKNKFEKNLDKTRSLFSGLDKLRALGMRMHVSWPKPIKLLLKSGWTEQMLDLSILLHTNCFFYLLIWHKIFSSILLWDECHQCQNTSITAISSLVSVSAELDLSAHVSHDYLFCFSTNHNRSYLTRDHRITSPTPLKLVS